MRCSALRGVGGLYVPSGLAGLAFIAGVGCRCWVWVGCLRTDGRFAGKCVMSGGAPCAGGASFHAVRIVAVWRACGPCWRVKRGALCREGVPPPVGASMWGCCLSPNFFFIFFLGGGCGSVGHGVGCVGSVRNATRTGQECNIMQSR